MVIWPHKRQSGKSGQNTPDSGSRKRHLIGAEKGLFEYCVVGLSCIGQNAKAQIVERDSGVPELAEIYDTCDGAYDCYREPARPNDLPRCLPRKRHPIGYRER